MLGLLIAITSCIAAALLASTGRLVGRIFGLATALLWLLAGLSAGTTSVAQVAAFCCICFALPLIRSALRRFHA
ncbi:MULTISPECIES: hypothetical protein [unclassified Burkholderia]|uniref:hypothetical protein n=1 Tax=unclassified Burkholderia TaxID=2613784 RepID=UPI000F578BA6|nr:MULTISPECIES: hypothetical protein [unclassified Burkholderia]RQR81468.1 hypothetical protein DIE10_17860 [Burkholderia sp. Bp9011]RQR91045.1 hypothetical protein DIE09_20100 [Burkholderia sp. Bp9010]RQS75192.1 hypothetical protein DID97_16465 [Burkholderia sp. Bp8977]